MKKTLKYLLILALLCCIPFFAGCSDDHDDDPVAASLSGVAASGLAMGGAEVTILDAAGKTRTVTTAANGSFTIDITGLTAPFALKAGDLYSAATTGGTTNVNPLTTVVFVASAGVDTPADGFEAARIALIPQTALDSAANAINTLLAPATTALGCNGDDFLHGSCPANHTGFDALFDAITVTISDGTLTINAGSTPLVSGTVANLGELAPMAADNVADVTSRLDWLSTYRFVSLDLDTPGKGATCCTGTLEIKADGTFIVHHTASSDDDTPADETGTFTLDDDGTLHLSSGENLVFNLGCTLFTTVDTDGDSDEDLGFTLGTRVEKDPFGGLITGNNYLAVDVVRDLETGDCSSGVARADFTETGSWSLTGLDGTNLDSGDYSLDADMLTGEIAGWLGEQGRVIILPDTDATEGRDVGFTLLFALKTGPTHQDTHGVDLLAGTYNYAELTGFPRTYTGSAAFNSTGSFTLNRTAASDGATGTETGTCTASTSVTMDGQPLEADSFVLDDDAIGFPVFSENLIVFPNLDEGGLSLLLEPMSWHSL